MRGIFRRQWVRVLAITLWVSAAALQGLAPAVSAFVSAPETEVQAAAIHLSGHGSPTCTHHPEGCPAHCLCPKTGFVGAGVSEQKAGAPGARLYESSWVECSESRAVSAPVFAVYLPAFAGEISVAPLSETRVTAAAARPRGAFLLPPAKVPIA